MIIPIQNTSVLEATEGHFGSSGKYRKVPRRKQSSPQIPPPRVKLCRDSLCSLTSTSFQTTSQHKCHPTLRATGQATTSQAELKVTRLSWRDPPALQQGCLCPGPLHQPGPHLTVPSLPLTLCRPGPGAGLGISGGVSSWPCDEWVPPTRPT